MLVIIYMAIIVLSLVGTSEQELGCNVGMYDYCRRAGDCLGRDIRHINANSENCKDACSQDCKCVSVQQMGNDCWLKDHRCTAEELNWSDQYNDWVKVKRGEGCAAWRGCSGGMYTYCRRAGDCLGRDIKHINANSESCLAACSKDCKCVSVQQMGNDCWLKNHRCTAQELNWDSQYNDWVKVNRGEGCAAWQGCNVGMYDYCHRAGDCYGRDIKHINANSDDCKKACSQDCRCVSVQQIGNDCWLKDHRCTGGELTWSGLYNDWVKVNRGEGCAAYPNDWNGN